jgi:hypothetical protein
MIKEAILDLWRGKLPLWAAYWGWGVLGGVAFGGLATVVEKALKDNPQSLFPIFAAAAIGITSIVYSVIAAVGVWRSANNYRGWRGWAILAKASVIIGILRAMAELAKVLQQSQ